MSYPCPACSKWDIPPPGKEAVMPYNGITPTVFRDCHVCHGTAAVPERRGLYSRNRRVTVDRRAMVSA